MNTMKKWLAAGMIGLVSTGMAWAAPDIDLNTTIWGLDAQPVTVTAAKPGTLDPAPTYDTAYVASILDLYMNNVGANRTAHTIVNGSALTFDMRKTATGTAYAEYFANYDLSFDTITPANYTGITIDFASALNSGFTLGSLGYVVELRYINAGNEEWAAYDLSGHAAGPLIIDWTSTSWDIGTLPLETITQITGIYFTFNINTVSAVNTTYTETLNSITLNGVADQGVPEPETVWMIVAVLASLGVTFRRQLMDFAGRFVKT